MKGLVSLVAVVAFCLIGIDLFAGDTRVEIQRRGLFGRRVDVNVIQPQKVVNVQQVVQPVHVQEVQVQRVQKVQRVQQIVVPQYVQQVQQVQRVVVPVQKVQVQRIQCDNGGCADFFN